MLETTNEQLHIELDDDLLLRQATPADAEPLADFNARVQSEEGADKPDEPIRVWTYDLLAKPHPTFKPGDFTLVEERKTGKIVSSMNLISQQWTYAGIPFKVGRPELVGTLPEYRNRGLVRRQFDVVHRWSQQRGELVQAITGIPYYYRLFGYEMAMNLGGGRVGYSVLVPRLKDGEQEPYHLRPATAADLDFISRVYNHGMQRDLVRCTWDEAMWRYELEGKSQKNVNRFELHIIETAESRPVGFVAHPFRLWGPTLTVNLYELLPGVSYGAVTPSLIRYLDATGKKMAEQLGKPETFGAFGFWLGADHPVYHAIPDKLPRVRPPYAWYLRVPDLPAFLRLVAPVLEQRLVESPVPGYTGTVRLTFYRAGLKMVFEQGSLKSVENWRPEPVGHSGEAAFPGLTFLQLLFGYRSLDELKYAFADCSAYSDEVYSLLNTLFPKQNSDVWPIS